MKINIGIMSMAQNLAAHASARQSVISENIANADTPGFKARDVASFGDTYNEPTRMGPARPMRAGHLDLNLSSQRVESFEDTVFGAESPNGNTVSLEDQMVRSAGVKYQHDLALGIYGKSMDIFRAGLGRIR